MKTQTESKALAEEWIQQWMQLVVSGESTMSQRKKSSVLKREIEVESLVKEAKKQNVHLLLLKDDKGEEFIAASLDEFTVLC